MQPITLQKLSPKDLEPGTPIRTMVDDLVDKHVPGHKYEVPAKLALSVSGYAVEQLASIHNSTIRSNSSVLKKTFTSFACFAGMLGAFGLGLVETVVRLVLGLFALLLHKGIQMAHGEKAAYNVTWMVSKGIFVTAEATLQSMSNALLGAFSIVFANRNVPKLSALDPLFSSRILHNSINSYLTYQHQEAEKRNPPSDANLRIAIPYEMPSPYLNSPASSVSVTPAPDSPIE